MNVGIVGLGYVGLPLAMEFADVGVGVVGVDVDAAKVAGLSAGRSRIEDVSDARLAGASSAACPTRAGDLTAVDAILICVPTPLNANREPELGPVLNASRAVGPMLRPASASCSSRRLPGTTRE